MNATYNLISRLDNVKAYLLRMASNELSTHQEDMWNRAWREADYIQNDLRRGYIEAQFKKELKQ